MDNGWEMLINIEMPCLFELSAADNGLKNIKINTQILNLSTLCLADNRRTGSFPKILSESTIM